MKGWYNLWMVDVNYEGSTQQMLNTGEEIHYELQVCTSCKVTAIKRTYKQSWTNQDICQWHAFIKCITTLTFEYQHLRYIKLKRKKKV